MDKTQLYSVGLPIGLSICLVAIAAVVGIIFNWKGEGRVRTDMHTMGTNLREDMHLLDVHLREDMHRMEDRLIKSLDALQASVDRISERLERHSTDIAALKRKTGTV